MNEEAVLFDGTVIRRPKYSNQRRHMQKKTNTPGLVDPRDGRCAFDSRFLVTVATCLDPKPLSQQLSHLRAPYIVVAMAMCVARMFKVGCVCVHTYMHVYLHACMHACMHACSTHVICMYAYTVPLKLTAVRCRPLQEVMARNLLLAGALNPWRRQLVCLPTSLVWGSRVIRLNDPHTGLAVGFHW